MQRKIMLSFIHVTDAENYLCDVSWDFWTACIRKNKKIHLSTYYATNKLFFGELRGAAQKKLYKQIFFLVSLGGLLADHSLYSLWWVSETTSTVVFFWPPDLKESTDPAIIISFKKQTNMSLNNHCSYYCMSCLFGVNCVRFVNE